MFKGTEQPVKEYDCVLIYDEELEVSTCYVVISTGSPFDDTPDVHS